MWIVDKRTETSRMTTITGANNRGAVLISSNSLAEETTRIAILEIGKMVRREITTTEMVVVAEVEVEAVVVVMAETGKEVEIAVVVITIGVWMTWAAAVVEAVKAMAIVLKWAMVTTLQEANLALRISSRDNKDNKEAVVAINSNHKMVTATTFNNTADPPTQVKLEEV